MTGSDMMLIIKNKFDRRERGKKREKHRHAHIIQVENKREEKAGEPLCIVFSSLQTHYAYAMLSIL